MYWKIVQKKFRNVLENCVEKISKCTGKLCRKNFEMYWKIVQKNSYENKSLSQNRTFLYEYESLPLPFAFPLTRTNTVQHRTNTVQHRTNTVQTRKNSHFLYCSTWNTAPIQCRTVQHKLYTAPIQCSTLFHVEQYIVQNLARLLH